MASSVHGAARSYPDSERPQLACVLLLLGLRGCGAEQAGLNVWSVCSE